MPDGYMWHHNDATFQGKRGRLYRIGCISVRYVLYKVLQYDKFFNVKGLVEEFKEFVRPKSIKDRMEAKQKVVEKQKCEQVVNSTARREKDIAI